MSDDEAVTTPSFELGPDQVELQKWVHTFAEGSFSGVKVDMRQGWLWEVRDGRFTRWHLYPNVEAALEAARALEEGRVQG